MHTFVQLSDIKLIPHHKIDFEAWDALVEKSRTTLPYLQSWYLNLVSHGQWDALVLGDYIAAMPLPRNEKIPFVKQVYQPRFTQQLGIISSAKTQVQTAPWLEAVSNHFRVGNLNFAVKQLPKSGAGYEVLQHSNYILELQRPGEHITANYSKSLKKRLKKCENLTVNNTTDIEGIITFYQKNVGSRSGLSKQEFKLGLELFKAAYKMNQAKAYTVSDDDGAILASGIYLDFKGRLVNVFGSSNERGRDLFAMHALLNYVIQTHAESHELFDFEGSDISGVQEFFESFGSVNEPYFSVHYNRLPWPVQKVMQIAKILRPYMA